MLLWESSFVDFWVGSSFIWMLGGGNWRIRLIWSRFDEIEFVTERNANWKNSRFSPLNFCLEVKAILIFHEFLKTFKRFIISNCTMNQKPFLSPKSNLNFRAKILRIENWKLWILAPKIFVYVNKKSDFQLKKIWIFAVKMSKIEKFEFSCQKYLFTWTQKVNFSSKIFGLSQ